ncbi:VCBS repeat-containing protein [Mesoflavibacter zeaxanthinifaciens]|uniref:VCBS repeat-containing protein n=1 Tax=Mesoflavibacter zeaxanthinifaciens TaxID=393060 RepID=UPI0026ECCCB2|nr:VCBS repeat-containing protein [Mesoflavibacter zeaxanthinifaciens]
MKKYISIFIVIITLFSCNKKTDQNKQNITAETYLLERLQPEQTGITFKNIISENTDHSIINYIYFYNGSGVAAGDINNDGLVDLYFASNQNRNKLYLNKGNFKFEDISESANINSNSSWNTGVTMVDINNDGFLDIYLCSVSGLLDFTGRNELFINNGDGTFTEKAEEFGLDFTGYSTQAYFFDYDKDLDLDVYIVNHAIHTSISHGPASIRSNRTPLVGDVLLRNDNGKFVDVSEDANIYGGANSYGLSASLADFNNDGWDDLYVCNDFHEDDYYYINQKDGTFKESLKSAFTATSRFSMGSDAADINADGLQDIITLDMLPKDEKVIKETEGDEAMLNKQSQLKRLGYSNQYSRNMLQINNQNGAYFYDAAIVNNIENTDWSWGPLIADFNNDSHQDIFIANGILRRPNGLDFRKYVANAFKSRSRSDGLEWLFKSINEMPRGEVANEIYQGDSEKLTIKTGQWIDKTPSLSNGAIYADLDNDGDLDIITNNLNDYPYIYKNNTDQSKNSVSLDLKFLKGNKEAIGSKAIVYTNKTRQLKQLFKSRGFLSSTEKKLHFGLNEENKIDSLVIIWPDLKVQTIENPEINTVLNINYSPNRNTSQNYYLKGKTENTVFNNKDIINYKHEEDNFNDFFNQKLIPYKVSTLGPAVAVADVDNNKYEDIFIGGASGKSSKLYLNNGYKLNPKNHNVFEEDIYCEDNSASLFDADGDGDLDLYVGSGINTNRIKKYENDRLYINENNTFKKSTNFPDNYLNTSTVVTYDYDNDGDIDIFIGNLSNPDVFGESTDSYILINDGKGNFKKDLNFKLSSKVTDAIWEDLNDDGVKDLIVTCQWDTPKIYLNNNGSLDLIKIPENLNGLWQTAITYDYDHDGDKDILLGNWGLNTRFNATKEKPLHMYFGDFDNNNIKETIIAYNIDGQYYPLNTKDELASQMNVISKRFVQHSDFSLKTVEEVLTPKSVKNAQLFYVDNLKSGILQNNNGSFDQFVPFPVQLQLSPITSFENISIDTKEQILIGGNNLNVTTYHGQYNSLQGYTFYSLDNITPVSNLGIKPFKKQVKSFEKIKTKNSNYLLTISNNDKVDCYAVK